MITVSDFLIYFPIKFNHNEQKIFMIIYLSSLFDPSVDPLVSNAERHVEHAEVLSQ